MSVQALSSSATKEKQDTVPHLPASKHHSRSNPLNLYAVLREKSLTRLREQIRKHTRRKAPLTLREMIEQINPSFGAGEPSIAPWEHLEHFADRWLPKPRILHP